MRPIDADALTEDCKRYLSTLNPDRDGKECTRIHWLIGVLANASTIEPEQKVEELLPDGTLHLFTDTDLSKVDRVWVSQNGTHFGDLYYADGEPKIGKWVGIKEYCDYLNEEAEREGKSNRYMPSGMNIHVYCNQCWEPNDRRTTYCPDCGCRMVQEGEEHDKG